VLLDAWQPHGRDLVAVRPAGSGGSGAAGLPLVPKSPLRVAGRGHDTPPPSTSGVPVSRVGQISKETLGYLSPADQMAVWRQGRLEQIGAPAPPPRTNGQHHVTSGTRTLSARERM
jgi:hypothetical protein